MVAQRFHDSKIGAHVSATSVLFWITQGPESLAGQELTPLKHSLPVFFQVVGVFVPELWLGQQGLHFLKRRLVWPVQDSRQLVNVKVEGGGTFLRNGFSALRIKV